MVSRGAALIQKKSNKLSSKNGNLNDSSSSDFTARRSFTNDKNVMADQRDMNGSLTECIETNLLKVPKSRRLRIHRRWREQRSLNEKVQVHIDEEGRQEEESPVMIPRDANSELAHVTSPQSLCLGVPRSEPPILRRVHSTGELSSRPEVEVSYKCSDSPFTAVISDVSGWLTPPHDALRMVDFSSLQLPNLFSEDGSVVTMSRSQQFDERTWNEVLMHHAPGGVLVVLAAVTTHPLLCAAALVAVGAQAWTWQSAPTNKPKDTPMMPMDVSLDATDCSSNESQFQGFVSAGDEQPPINDNESFALCNDPAFQRDWITKLYPPLESELLSNIGGFVGIQDVTQFIQVFCSDDAPFSFQAFQEKRGDRNVQYGCWEPCENLDQVSFLPSDRLALSLDHSLLTRRLTFEAKTNNNYVGPTYASTTKQQRLLIVNANLAVLESETAVSNVPFGDKFRIIDRWIFQMQQEIGFQITSYSSHVKLTGSCPFAAQIRSQSAKTLADVANAWIVMAHEALQITEQQQKVEGIELVQSLSGNVQFVMA